MTYLHTVSMLDPEDKSFGAVEMVHQVALVKIVGERNTGTNFVEDIIRSNFSVEICPGNLPRHITRAYRFAYKYFPYSVARRLVENDRDRRFDTLFDRYAGWKHARMPNLPKTRARYPEGLGFIAITKNPYAWLQSLYRHPYQGTHHSPAHQLSFSEFLRTPWPTVRREYGPAEYANPVQMWNDKVASYESLHSYGPALILPYEGVITDIEAFVRTVARSFDLPEPAQVQVRADSTKKDGRSTADIVQYYLSGAWADSLLPEDLDFINRELDHSLCEMFGYTLIAKEIEKSA